MFLIGNYHIITRPCPPAYPSVYTGLRFNSDVSIQNITRDVEAFQTSDKVGFGWNTAGALTVSTGTGKNYGVLGQGNGMPSTSLAASYDQHTSNFPHGLMITVAP